MGWFAIYSKPQQEALCHRDLKRLGIGVFYPTHRIRRHVRQNGALIPKWIQKPYFPRWLFANTPMVSLYEVTTLRSVSGIGSSGDTPVEIPSDVMQVLMAGADPEGVMGSRDEVSRKRFMEAAKIRFLPGSPLEGIIGTIMHDGGGSLIDVLISMLGGDRHVAVPHETLEAVA